MIRRSIIYFVLFLYVQIPVAANPDEYSQTVLNSPVAQTVDTLLPKNTDTDNAGKKGGSGTTENIMIPPDIREIVSIPKIIWSLVFLIAGYFILQILERIINLVAERQAKYRLSIKSVIPIIKIFGWIFIFFVIIAGIFQPPMATIFAFAASIGVAIGFASQDILKNIFGGITILFDQPFKVGDKIESGNYYGEVIEIGLRSTRIITPDDSKVSIPNGELMNQSVSNANSGESNCQVAAEIFLPVGINTQEVREIATEAVKVSKYVYLNKPITVLFSHIIHEEREYLKMTIKAYVLDIRDEFKFKSDIVELVLDELGSKGIIK
jgi:small-conductance mechanosensitive channel